MERLLQAESGPQIAAARTLFLEYREWLGLDLSFQDFQSELASLPGAYAPPGGRLLLAEVAGELAGCAALRPFTDDRGEVKRLFVRPRFQGTGLGRRLMTRIVADARAIGYRRLLLDTLPQMGTAMRLYESLGFRDTEPYRYNPVPGTRFLELEL